MRRTQVTSRLYSKASPGIRGLNQASDSHTSLRLQTKPITVALQLQIAIQDYFCTLVSHAESGSVTGERPGIASVDTNWHVGTRLVISLIREVQFYIFFLVFLEVE